MTVLADTPVVPAAPLGRGPSRPPRVLAACAALLVAYIGLSFLNNPHGYLGTDTGGKVATLQAMERGGAIDPDVGYWAQAWDPSGRLHPLYYTAHFGDKWVNATTLPALYAAYPLFKLFGYRGALLLPMVGSVLAALAARALARRLRPGDERTGWVAFWLVGLGSPMTVYALDFWEHSLGVALVAWAVVLLYDVVEGRAGWRAGLAAGVLVGLAATMRTETLVYGAVATALACGTVLVRRRNLLAPLLVGVAVVAGLAMPLAANQVLESATIGHTLRADRAAGTVRSASTAEGSRMDEALLTAASPNAILEPSSYLLGAGLLALLVTFSLRGAQGAAGARMARIAFGGVVAIYLIRAANGLGFVPGLFAATPLAAVGLALGGQRRRAPDDDRSVLGSRFVLAVALLAMPLVWVFQFTGGAGPQWAGRYILPSGLLLAVVGVTSLPLLARWARTGVTVVAVAVTCFGLAWLSVRSHDVGRASAALARRPEPVLVSRVAHLAREGGWYAGDHKWLTAVTDDDVQDALRVLAESGTTTFGLVRLEETGPVPDFAGWRPVATTSLRYISNVRLSITTFERT